MTGSAIYVRDNSNNKNVILEVDSSNQLSVKDVTAQSSLSSINSNMATASNQSTANTSLSNIETNMATATNQSTANSHLSSISSNQSTANSSLSNIELNVSTAANQSTANSHLSSISSNQSTANGHLSNIESSLAGTLTVSSGFSRNAATLESSSSKSSGDVSSSIDNNSYKEISFYGSCSDNSGQFRIQVSDNNSDFYEIHPSQYVNASNGHFYYKFDSVPRYVRVEFLTTATWTVKYTQRS